LQIQENSVVAVQRGFVWIGLLDIPTLIDHHHKFFSQRRQFSR
jgi:hypothetical protein